MTDARFIIVPVPSQDMKSTLWEVHDNSNRISGSVRVGKPFSSEAKARATADKLEADPSNADEILKDIVGEANLGREQTDVLE